VHVIAEDEILVDDMYSLYKELGIQFSLDNQNPQDSNYLKNYKVSMTREIHYMYYKRSIILVPAGALEICHQNLLMHD
jgi:hypothetical protein